MIINKITKDKKFNTYPSMQAMNLAKKILKKHVTKNAVVFARITSSY